MSFLVVVEQGLENVAEDALSAGKTIINYVDGVATKDVIPALETALLAAIEKFGQELVAEILGNAATPAPAAPVEAPQPETPAT